MIEKLKNFLENDTNILFAYLFGSFAKGEAHARSDVDIAVYFKEESFNEQLRVIYELSKLVKRDVDLVVLNHVKNMFLLEEIMNGELLKDSDTDERAYFEVKKMHEIIDYKSFKRRLNVA